MEILAIETKYSPYFEKLICESDILVRVRPLTEKADVMAKRVMTPETNQRAEVEMATLWHHIMADLPAAYQRPFSATEFVSAIREGQMDLSRLADIIVPHGRLTCPERLQFLGDTPEAREARLHGVLLIMFRRIVCQGVEELANVDPGHVQKCLKRYNQLPDLYKFAHASGAKDIHAEQDRLARAYDLKKIPYRLSMPYRHPARLCQSGEHTVAEIKYTLVDPVHNARVDLWEAELHAAQVHDAGLPTLVASFLECLTDGK